MATVPVFVGFGNSNWDGIAPLSGVPLTDFVRWVSSFLPTVTFTQPFVATAPGIRVFTPRLPYATAVTSDITAQTATTYSVTTPFPAATNDSWVYVLENSTGQGQHRRITASPTANPTTVDAWGTAIATNGRMQWLSGSHTSVGASVNSIVNDVPVTTFTKTATTTAFTSAAAGKWLIGLSGSNAGVSRKVLSFTSATVLVCEQFPNAFAAGDGVRLLEGANAVNSFADLASSANSTLQDLTFFYDNAISYSTGVDYPNIKSAPLNGPSRHKSVQYVNVLPELTWQFRKRFDQKIHVVSVGASASTLRPQYTNNSLITEFSWAHDVTHLDFHPASPNGLYGVLTRSIAAACALIVAEGNTPDVIGIGAIIAENDAADVASAKAFGDNLRLVRDSLRRFVVDNNFTLRKPHEIPFLISNLKSSANPYAYIVNQAITDAATEDSRTGVVDTTDATYITTLHFDAPFYITLGQRFFDAWAKIFDRDNYAKRTLANLPTLASLRTAVRRRFERTTSANDSLAAQIDAFLNDSLKEVYNVLGDNAWFLRRAEPATIDSGVFPNTISLDGHVARILRIESAAYPGQALVWKGIAHTSNLRTQITLHDYCSGPFVVHFMQIPQDLSSDNDVSLVPAQYSELVVLLTCKRLAESAANSGLATYYGAETARVWSMVKRDCLRNDRMRQESMTTSPAYDTLRNGVSDGWLWSL